MSNLLCSHHLYLGNCQHCFDNLCIVSNRQDPEITTKESEKERLRFYKWLDKYCTLESQSTCNQNPAYISMYVKDRTLPFIYLCWISDRISSSFLPLKGAYRSRKLFRCTCTNVFILSMSPESSKQSGMSWGSTSKNAVPWQLIYSRPVINVKLTNLTQNGISSSGEDPICSLFKQ